MTLNWSFFHAFTIAYYKHAVLKVSFTASCTALAPHDTISHLERLALSPRHRLAPHDTDSRHTTSLCAPQDSHPGSPLHGHVATVIAMFAQTAGLEDILAIYSKILCQAWTMSDWRIIKENYPVDHLARSTSVTAEGDHDMTIRDRDGRFGHKLGQIDTKWDKFETF